MQKQQTAERNGELLITVHEAEQILEALRKEPRGLFHIGIIVNTDNWRYRTKTNRHFAQLSMPKDGSAFFEVVK